MVEEGGQGAEMSLLGHGPALSMLLSQEWVPRPGKHKIQGRAGNEGSARRASQRQQGAVWNHSWRASAPALSGHLRHPLHVSLLGTLGDPSVQPCAYPQERMLG